MSFEDQIIAKGGFVPKSGPVLLNHPTNAQLSKWLAQGHEVADDAYQNSVVGEIYWRKSMGRPKNLPLSDAFTITSWSDYVHSLDSAHPTQLVADITQPHIVKLWDGPSDDTFWRVSFHISGVIPGHVAGNPDIGILPYDNFTYIVPTFNDVPWQGAEPTTAATPTSFAQPYRVFAPYEIQFVKAPGPDVRSIQIVKSRFAPAHVKTPFSP